MKKAGHLIFLYFVTLCLSTLTLAFLYMVVHACMKMVAGYPIHIFSFSLFKDGCFIFLSFSALLALLTQIFSAIKYKDTSVLSFLIALFFTLFTWLLLLPISLTNIPDSFVFQSNGYTKTLSSNLFRIEDDVPVYYLHANDNGTYHVLRIHKNKFLGSPIEEDFSYIAQKKLFVDPLLEESVGYPLRVEGAVNKIVLFYALAQSAVHSGKVAWLCFASIGLSLFSLWMFVGASRWKIVNAVFVCSMWLFLLFIQIEIYSGTKVFEFVRILHSHISFSSNIDQFIPVFIYVLFSLIFSVTGLLRRHISSLGGEEK